MGNGVIDHPKMVAQRQPVPLLERFWKWVVKLEGEASDNDGLGPCWLYTAKKGVNGYGRIGLGGVFGRTVLVHRLSYALHFGNLPDEMDVHHKCRERRCVRPEHLELMDPIEHAKESNDYKHGRKYGPGRGLSQTELQL
jgi:hypothetical protein